MKQLLLFTFFFISGISVAFSQSCDPNQMYVDSTFGVYPSPYDSTTMMGGIQDTACINQYFATELTVVIPDEIDLPNPPITVALNSITVTDISGAPSGMDYVCNPPDCIFEPSDEMGCMQLYGTAEASNSPGDYVLALEGEVSTPLGNFDLGLVLSFLSNGSYFVTLEPEGSPNCTVVPVSTNDILSEQIKITSTPNPFSDFATININSEIAEDLTLNVFNVLGKLVSSQTIQLIEGDNTMEFDGTNLVNGIYHFTFTDGKGVLSQKLVVQK